MTGPGEAPAVTPFLLEEAPGLSVVRGFLHRPPAPGGAGLALTHGAGSDCRTTLLTGLADALARDGVTVLRCDLPFRQARPHGPPGRGDPERDRAGLARAVEAMRRLVPGPVLLGGHSYGGRQASMLAAQAPSPVAALVLLAYPLRPPRRPAEDRTAHFPAVRVPALFVHGTRDPFGSVAEIDAARAAISGPTERLAVEGAGHDLLPRGAAAAQRVIDSIAERVLVLIREIQPLTPAPIGR